ncbi:glycoside hydrolase family 38 C-terminal domain-containing protein [Microbacterium sp. cx-59]|uniref:alpha-mannosidase n=1 Tax=Microbacterium sp. cx-59 TaxID=2891207 RepID=UPI001E43608B|nr:glycoside hydrolase family 38 C-terminal domain-containing protein [Microbacterium sp. cx-59]MCC4909120.1 glycosyl hydrolase-related protein [Microbacterium sp. cx-59]
MHDRTALTELRIDRFIRERLEPAVYRAHHPLAVSAWEAPGEPVPFEVADAAEYVPFGVGRRWGRPWGTTWFHVEGAVPSEWWQASGELPEGTRAELVIDLGFTAGQSGFQAEALVWDRSGSPLKGVSPFNQAVPSAVDAAGRVDVRVEAASNPDVGSLFTFEPTHLGDRATAGTDPIYVLRTVEIGLRDVIVAELLADALALRGLAAQLDPTSARRAELLEGLDRMIDTVDPDDVAATAAAARAVLLPLLERPAHASAHTLHAVGHAHIDSAWLWPVRETARKVSRTFANVLALMNEDPDVVFASSSAQQFAWVKEYYPALWARLVERVREGRFVPVGGMWVESDTNMVGGEAMARQLLEGKSFFLEEFGIETPEVWLPDSFGYSGALPQIIRASGSKWFLTQKISWNETNRMPHHTFLWEGIDGTRLFTHFPPVDKYNSDVSAEDLAHAQRNFADKGRTNVSLLPYGYGDGGGGPTREMAATIARTGSLEGSPIVEHSTPARFFETAEREYADPEVWAGELYLEFHRGTYTSQLRTKQGNRRSEHLLREAELWAATASVRAGVAYPAATLKRLWQLTLLQQFHDILPGSSIAWVHRDAERNYAAIATELTDIIDESLRVLAGSGDHTLRANAAPHARGAVPALALGSAPAEAPVAPVRVGDDLVLDNGVVRAVIDPRGLIVSLVEVGSGREVVPPGSTAGLFQLHRDTPTQWDAWDIDEHYRRHVIDLVDAESVAIEGDAVVITRRFGDSRLVQRITLFEGSRTLRLSIDVDWHERQKLLKLSVPVDVHTDRAQSEIQFGHIVRPTHTNTSWDAARFETVAHRWVRVAEPDFGVAVTNDSTYGHDITRHARTGGGTVSIVRLSVIRGALFPDPQQDQGEHHLEVGIVVGAQTQDAVTEGYRANLPERVVTGAGVGEVAPLVRVEDASVVIEAVKLAEDGSGDVIVRLYESLGHRAATRVVPGFAASGVIETDLLEREIPAAALVAAGSDGAEIALRPFQLATLRFIRS